jgi:hypothetical protein
LVIAEGAVIFEFVRYAVCSIACMLLWSQLVHVLERADQQRLKSFGGVA